MAGNNVEIIDEQILETSDKNTKKNKKKSKKGFRIFMFMALILLIGAQVGFAILIDTMDNFGAYSKSVEQAWKDESPIIQNRCSIMILDNDDYRIGEVAEPYLKYGVVESYDPNLSDKELAMISRYKYNNFDENFDIDKCHIFSAKIDGGTYYRYDMTTIFGGAFLGHDRFYSPATDEEAVYKYVVSYVEKPEITNSLTDKNLFVQLSSWLDLSFKYRYVALALEIIVCILFALNLLYWFVLICKALLRFFKTLKFVPKTTISLIIFTIVGGFFTFVFGSLFGEDDLVFFFILADVFFVIPVVVYLSYQTKVLADACAKLASGDMDVHINSNGFFGDFKKQAKSINTIRDSINLAVEERMKSERLKTELITNVSHDIKTPLTSIINYVDLLSKEEFENDTAREYIEVLDRQSVRLKKLIMDLIEASKAATGNIELEMMPCDAKLILEQVVGEYEEKMEAQNLSLVVRTPESSATIMADSKSLFRIFDNLLVNMQKYSLENTRAYVDLELVGNKAVFVFRNMSKEPLAADGNLFMERFYQGDISRSAEGNGLGLAVAKSLTELMDGTIEIVTDGDLFKVTISFNTCID